MSISLEQLQNDLQGFNAQKDQLFSQFHQIIGAISVIEQQIKILLTTDAKKNDENDLNSNQTQSVSEEE